MLKNMETNAKAIMNTQVSLSYSFTGQGTATSEQVGQSRWQGKRS